MPDWWETYYGLNKNSAADAAVDTDTDGLTNLQEYQRKTNPQIADTDADGFLDGVETGTGFWTSPSDTGTDPLNPDFDGDGLLDGAETKTGVFVSATNAGTDPYATDSDLDGYGDYTEVLLNSSPVSAASIPVQPGALNLLAYWDFNSPTVATQAVDRIHSYVGKFEGDAAYAGDRSGRTGQAGDQALNCGTNGTALVRNLAGQWLSAAAPNNAITISFWQKWAVPIVNSFAFYGVSPSVPANDGIMRGLSAHTPWGDGTIYWDTGGTIAGASRISANINTITNVVPGYPYTDANGFFLNKWRHFAFVKNGDTKQIWVDGILLLEAANTKPIVSDFTQFLMGGSPNEPTSFRGLQDDFAVYASALDPDEHCGIGTRSIPHRLLNAGHIDDLETGCQRDCSELANHRLHTANEQQCHQPGRLGRCAGGNLESSNERTAGHGQQLLSTKEIGAVGPEPWLTHGEIQ